MASFLVNVLPGMFCLAGFKHTNKENVYALPMSNSPGIGVLTKYLGLPSTQNTKTKHTIMGQQGDVIHMATSFSIYLHVCFLRA